MQVIPAINESDFAEVKQKAQLVAGWGLVDWVQLDVTDGSLTEVVGWHEANEVEQLPKGINYEVHLMTRGVEEKIENWLESGVKRIIWQMEAGADNLLIRDKIKKRSGVEAGLAVSYEADLEAVKKLAKEFAWWQVLAVPMGRSGQEFKERALEVVRVIKAENPKARVEVDGGVNKEVAEKAKQAGAEVVAVSSYIFKNSQPEEAVRQLQAI